MQTLTGSSSQHSYFGGTTSCTSSASLFARYILDKIPRKKGVDKICEAGANLWLRWKKEEDIPHSNFQTWIDVQKTYPQLFKDTKLIHETNGFMGNEPQEKNDDDGGTQAVAGTPKKKNDADGCGEEEPQL